ncbi:MmpS family transport accessory protein [Nocardia sp. A7]|uniref:MmpS family transport accessory protein n=1 Tax=Nocardia sp. A7 TaxID=2789274 RepID=UPI00397CC906
MNAPQQPYGQQPYGQQPPYGQQTPGGGYPQQGGYPQPPRKKKVWPWVLGGILVVLLLIVGGCVAFVGTVANEIGNEASREVAVSYQATGSGTGTVIYSDGTLDVQTEADVPLPWSKDVTITGLVKQSALSVMSSFDGGTVSCKIVVDGKVIAQDEASGSLATATCAGDAGK